MSARLPVPGSDEGKWGEVLNNYLSQVHSSSGSLKSKVVNTVNIVDGAVTADKIDPNILSQINSGGGAVGPQGPPGVQGPAGDAAVLDATVPAWLMWSGSNWVDGSGQVYDLVARAGLRPRPIHWKCQAGDEPDITSNPSDRNTDPGLAHPLYGDEISVMPYIGSSEGGDEGTPPAQEDFPFALLHLNGPEYGVFGYTSETSTFSNANLGVYNTHYHYESQASLNYLSGRGWTHVKVPIRWERVQDTIAGPLRQFEVDHLSSFLDRCHLANLKVVLDVHNYGLYYRDVSGTGTRTAIGDPELPISAFADLWTRLATQFSDHPAIMGYALMAEPQDAGGLTQQVWQDASQAAVNAIRGIDTETEIHVAGWNWSSVRYWDYSNGPTAWIDDSSGGIIRYEGHHYWDGTGGGSYDNSYATEVIGAESTHFAGPNPDALHTKVFEELTNYNQWLQTNGVLGIVGEVGWPGISEWDTLAQDYLSLAKSYNIPIAAWSAGEWVGESYTLGVYSGSPISSPRSQGIVLEGFL